MSLGLVALGGLLGDYMEGIQPMLVALSVAMAALVVAKACLFPAMVRDDFQNPVFASVSATLFMAIMQICAFFAPVAFAASFAFWATAVLGHLALMAWFTMRHVREFRLEKVFPTYFICYVGIIVASVTSPIFGMEALGSVLFWFGFACYAVLFTVITLRYIKHSIPEPARPLFCIYAAPMSLSIAGYLSVTSEPNLVFVAVLAVLAQVLFVVVLTQLPKFIAGGFYPSFAAMTFPFVITAVALGMVLDVMAAAEVALPMVEGLRVLAGIETLFATAMVFFVLGHYVRFLASALKPAPAVAVAEPAAEVLSAE